MPKELHEIRGFHKGTIGSASESDIPDTAASTSVDISPIAPAGLIETIREDTLHNESAVDDYAFNAAKVLGDSGKHNVITIDTSNGGDRKVKLIDDLYEVYGDTTITALSGVQGGSTAPPAMEANNKEVHIGMGTGTPLWAGKVTHRQFGEPPAGYIADSSKIGISKRLGIALDQFYDGSTYVYRLLITGELERITASSGALHSHEEDLPYGEDTPLRMCSGKGLTADALLNKDIIFLSQNASKTSYFLHFWDWDTEEIVSYSLDNPAGWSSSETTSWGESISQMRLDTKNQTVYFYSASGKSTVWDSDEFNSASPVRIWRTEVSTVDTDPDISTGSAIGEIVWKWENIKPILKNDVLEAEKPGQFWIDPVLYLGQWITGGGAPGLVDNSSDNITNFHTCVKNFHDYAAIGEFTGIQTYDDWYVDGKFVLIEVGKVPVRGNGGLANFVFQTQVGTRVFHSGTVAVMESQSSSAFSSEHDDHAQHSLYSFVKDSKDCWKFEAEHPMGPGNGAFPSEETGSGYIQWITATGSDEHDAGSGLASTVKKSYSKLLSEIDEKTGLMLIERDWAEYSIVRVESNGAFVVVTTDLLEDTGAEDGSPPYVKSISEANVTANWVETHPQGNYDPFVLEQYNWPKIMGKVGPGFGPQIGIEATTHYYSAPNIQYAWSGMLLSGGNAYTFGIAQDVNAGTVFKRAEDYAWNNQHICFMQMKKIACVGGASSVNGFEAIGQQLALTHTVGARMTSGNPWEPIPLPAIANPRKRGDLRVGTDGGVFPGCTAVITFIPDYSVCSEYDYDFQWVIMSQRYENDFVFNGVDTTASASAWGILSFGFVSSSETVGVTNRWTVPDPDDEPHEILSVYQSYPFQSTVENAADSIHSWLALVLDKATGKRYIRVYRMRGADNLLDDIYDEDSAYFTYGNFKQIFSRELRCTNYYNEEIGGDSAVLDNIYNIYNISITKVDENNFSIVESPESTTESSDGISDRKIFLWNITGGDITEDLVNCHDAYSNGYGREDNESEHSKGITRNGTHKHTIGMWGAREAVTIDNAGKYIWNLGSLAHDETASDTPTEVHVNTHILKDTPYSDRSPIHEPAHGLVSLPQNSDSNAYGIGAIFRFERDAYYRYEGSFTDWKTMFKKVYNVFVLIDTIRGGDDSTWIGNAADSNISKLIKISDSGMGDGTFLDEASAVSDGIAADRRAAPVNTTTSTGELLIFQLKATGAQYDRIVRINDTQLDALSNGDSISPTSVTIASPDEKLGDVSVEQKTTAGDVGSFFISNTDGNAYMSLFTNDWSDNTQTSTELSQTGVNITFGWGSASTEFVANTRYFYSISYLYDGYQESPLSAAFYEDQDGTANDIQVTITLRAVAAGLNKRISHVQLYRAKAADGTTTATPQGFYRLLTSIPLATGWEATGTGNVDRAYDHYLDQGSQGASYSAITGMLESVTTVTPAYTVSTQLNNHHFIGNCVIGEEDDASNYVIKSMPYNFDQFNWVEDSLKLPESPVALAAFQGKVYAFGGNTIYRIEPNNLFIEDIFHGVGAINSRSVISTEYGMFILDKNNIYLHDGRAPRPIGRAILNGVTHSWEEASKDTSVAAFNSGTNSFMALFSADYFPYSWNYQIDANRWDLHKFYPEMVGYNLYEDKGFLYGKDGEILYSRSGSLYKLFGNESSGRRGGYWVSKRLDMGASTQIKIFRKIIITAVDSSGLPVTFTGNAGFKSDSGLINNASSVVNGAKEYKLSGASSKAKWIQVYISQMEVLGIDSIGIVFRRRGVK